jgi:hypothetical protein
VAAAAATGPGGAGPAVRVSFDRDQSINRLWGIPLFGIAVRAFLAIPHFLVLWVLGVLSALSVLVTWIPVLVVGRLPGWALELYVTTYRWSVRVTAWVLLMVGPYPPFSSIAPYPVNLEVRPDASINRLWGIPFLGIWVRGLLVIPHVIVLFILSIGIGFAMLVTWIPVLVNGRFPQLGYDLFGGYLRLSTRMSLWTLLVPTPYPSISPLE